MLDRTDGARSAPPTAGASAIKTIATVRIECAPYAMTTNVLTTLVDALATGAVKVVDLTAPLGPATPVIGLPPMFAASPGMTIDVISKYDDRGPAWYWNTIRLGEHTGTHFDAPIHWITGRHFDAPIH